MCFVSTTNSNNSTCCNCGWNVLQICRDCCGNIIVRGGSNCYYNYNNYSAQNNTSNTSTSGCLQRYNYDNGCSYGSFGRCARSNGGYTCGCSD